MQTPGSSFTSLMLTVKQKGNILHVATTKAICSETELWLPFLPMSATGKVRPVPARGKRSLDSGRHKTAQSPNLPDAVKSREACQIKLQTSIELSRVAWQLMCNLWASNFIYHVNLTFLLRTMFDCFLTMKFSFCYNHMNVLFPSRTEWPKDYFGDGTMNVSLSWRNTSLHCVRYGIQQIC